MDFKPKHTIFDSEKFQRGREKLGGLILEGMKATGGTDVDWLIERKGGFIILENKEFVNHSISISLGLMIAFEKLFEKLEAEMQESKQKLETEMLAGKQKLEAERQRLEEKRKESNRIRNTLDNIRKNIYETILTNHNSS